MTSVASAALFCISSVEALRGTANTRMTTDQILALTREGAGAANRRK